MFYVTASVETIKLIAALTHKLSLGLTKVTVHSWRSNQDNIYFPFQFHSDDASIQMSV